MKRSIVGKLTAGILGSALLVFGVVSGSRFRSEIRSARERIDRLGSQVIETECGPVEFARAGEGTPVLVIHGNGGGFDQGLALAQSYLDAGFQVIAPSRFGYLRTPLPAGATPAMQADAYACLLDALEIRQAAIFTTSAGVTSSVQFALRHPERVTAMVFHSPNAPGKVEVTLPPQPVFQAMMGSDFIYWLVGKNMMSMFVPKDLRLTEEMQTEVKEAMAGVLPSSARARGMVFDTYVGNKEINGYPLEQVTTPTLVVSAVDDPAALHENARTLAARIPGGRLVAIPDGGHLMLGHTETVKTEVTQFLRNIALQNQNSLE